MEVGKLGEIIKSTRPDVVDLIVGQVEVDKLLQSLECLGFDLFQLTLLHVQRDKTLAFAEGPCGDAADVVPLQVQQTCGL